MQQHGSPRHAHCSFVPPHVLDHLSRATAGDRIDPTTSQRSAVISKQLRDRRRRTVMGVDAIAALGAPTAGKSERQIHDCLGDWDFDVPVARGEDDPPVESPESVNLAHDHTGATRDYYQDVHGRNGIDNTGSPIKVYANYGIDFNNAFWDGTRIVLGTGDGVIFTDFSKSMDVMGHELTHGVVTHTANLEYFSQSGALNEHFADVFGTLVEQTAKGQDAGTADWLIGDDIMGPELYGEALRSMAHPGTAYDNDLLGRDPQPDHMRDYFTGPEDNQGVHINSGIPNRAFYLTAMEIGTPEAGLIWYSGLLKLGPTSNFADAALAIGTAARLLARDRKVDRQAAQTVRAAFRAVGIG
jgi:Zn-dependent metalloprotease